MLIRDYEPGRFSFEHNSNGPRKWRTWIIAVSIGAGLVGAIFGGLWLVF